MRTLIFSLFFLLNSSIYLIAAGSLTEEIPSSSGRSVPFVKFEAMKMDFDICVCESETPEQAAKSIADVMKQFPESLNTLQMLPSAPAHLLAHFGEIKLQVDQIIHHTDVLVADATPVVMEKSLPRLQTKEKMIINNSNAPKAQIAELKLQLHETVKHETLMVKRETVKQDDVSLLAFDDSSGPSTPSGGEPDTLAPQSLLPFTGIFVAAIPDLSIAGRRVAAVIYDQHVRAQQEIAEGGSIIKISILPIKKLAPRYLEVLYVMFLLTILANYFGRSTVIFARTRRLN